jgi:hypothetical protein
LRHYPTYLEPSEAEPIIASYYEELSDGGQNGAASCWRCRVCDQRWADPGAVRQHLLGEHLRLLLYKCAACGTKTATAEELSSHQELAHGSKGQQLAQHEQQQLELGDQQQLGQPDQQLLQGDQQLVITNQKHNEQQLVVIDHQQSAEHNEQPVVGDHQQPANGEEEEVAVENQVRRCRKIYLVS